MSQLMPLLSRSTEEHGIEKSCASHEKVDIVAHRLLTKAQLNPLYAGIDLHAVHEESKQGAYHITRYVSTIIVWKINGEKIKSHSC